MVKEIIKKIIAQSNVYRVSRNRFIFLFHDIALASEPQFSEEYSILPENFYEIVEYIRRNFEVLSLDEIVDSKTEIKNKPTAAIMFDDGFYSVYNIAFPYLKERNIPFAISVNKRAVCQNRLWFTDLAINKNNNNFWVYIKEKLNVSDSRLDQIKKMEIFNFFIQYSDTVIDWDLMNETKVNEGAKIFCDKADLKKMLDSGIVTINSHSCNHYMVSKCTDENIYSEIKVNKVFVEEITGVTEHYFTLPFGKSYTFDDRVLKVCSALGYSHIFTTNTTYFKKNDLQGSPVLIPRFGINNGPVSEMKFNVNMSIFRNIFNKQA